MERGNVELRRIPPLGEPNRWARALQARRAAGAPSTDLTVANPTQVGLAPDPGILGALADARGARYDPEPLGDPVARAAVAGFYADRGVRVDASQVVLTAGTSEAYAHLFRLLAAPGETVLAPEPSYPLFAPLAALEGVRLEPYRIAWDGAWHLDTGSFQRGLEAQPRAAIVVQPHVPTGASLSAAECGQLEARCAEAGVALISDEVFGDFPWPGQLHPLPGFAGRERALTFVLNGLSKVCGLPQLKLSWIVVSGPQPARRQALAGLEWISDLFLSVAAPVQLALPALLETRHEFQRRVAERLTANLARLETLEVRAPEVRLLRGQGGWSAVLQLPARQDSEAWALELLEHGVITHPGSFYDLERGSHLVVSLLVEPEEFDRGMGVLEATI